MMTEWSILFAVSESDEAKRLKQELQPLEEKWKIVFESDPDSVLKTTAEEPFNVVFCDLNLGGISGVDLLNEIWRKYPQMARFILADTTDNDVLVNCVLGTHQILPKGSSAEKIKATVENSIAIDNLIQNKNIKSLVSRMRTFPSMPSSYFEVMRELGSPDASAEKVGEIIGKDLAMTTKMIQMVNSAFFGMQRNITDPTEAVVVLGLETVRSLVLSIQAFAQFDKVKPIYFSIDRVWKHSMTVAKTAKKIVMFESEDPNMANEAYAAGLLHDIGKLVLATNMEDQYNGALKLAKNNGLKPWDVEKEVFGATHGEIGAYMLAHWGLPVSVIEAAALHHDPDRSVSGVFSPLTAIHVANAFEHETFVDKHGFTAPEVSTEYLEKIGMSMRLDLWRDIVLAGGSGSASADQKDEPAPAPVAVPQLAESTSATSLPGWLVPVASAVCILVIIAIVFASRNPDLEDNSSGVSLANENIMAVSASEKETLPTSPRPVTVSLPEQPEVKIPLPSEQALPVNPASIPRPEPVVNTVPEKPAEEKPVAKKPPLTLQGIMYSRTSPSAMINGQTVYQGDEIEGGRVVFIGKTKVILDFIGRRSVLEME